MKTEILFGIHPVLEGLRAGRRPFRCLFLAQHRADERTEAISAAAAARGVPVRRVSSEKLRALSGAEVHQGVCAEVGPLPVAADPLPDGLRNPFLLIADSVTDPHNLGALIRTALCAGVDGVVLPRDRAAGPSPVVSKASAGAMEHIRIHLATNLARTLEDLKKKGVWISGMAADGSRSIFESDLTGPLAVVIGGEGKGLRPLIRRQCDFLLTIPQKGPVSSLNASVAGAVVMYEAFRQRLSGSEPGKK